MSDAGPDPRIMRALDERAKRLAESSSAVERRKDCQIAVLLVGKTQIGIAVDSLREVQHAAVITPLPGLPEGMLGVAQVRGEVLCIVDLSRWIGTAERGVGGCLVVVEGPRGPLGLVADRCVGFRDVFEDDLVADVASANAARLRYVHKLTRDMCAIVDVTALLEDPRLIVGTSRGRNAEGKP